MIRRLLRRWLLGRPDPTLAKSAHSAQLFGAAVSGGFLREPLTIGAAEHQARKKALADFVASGSTGRIAFDIVGDAGPALPEVHYIGVDYATGPDLYVEARLPLPSIHDPEPALRLMAWHDLPPGTKRTGEWR